MTVTSALHDQIQTAIGAHGLWKTRLQQAIQTGASEFQVSAVRLDNQCPFGKWLYGGIEPSTRSSSHYEKVRALHARFHVEAANVLGLALGDKKAEATAAMSAGSPYAHVSAELTRAMMAWLQTA